MKTTVVAALSSLAVGMAADCSVDNGSKMDCGKYLRRLRLFHLSFILIAFGVQVTAVLLPQNVKAKGAVGCPLPALQKRQAMFKPVELPGVIIRRDTSQNLVF